MNEIGVFNETNIKVDEFNEIEKISKYLVKYMNLDNIVYNIILVDTKTIKKLNCKYRKIDKETDVISFALEDSPDNFKNNIRVLGDIYICLDKAKKQALEYGHSLKRELCFLTTHGFLHLLGFDHMKIEDEKIMFKLQEEILDSYGIKR